MTALALLALLTFGASTAFAKTWRCMVINDRINTTYKYHWPESTNPVQTAIDEASPWDTIWIRGYCPGPVEITKSLTLEGQEIRGWATAPTIDAWMAEGGTTAQKSVVHVSGSGVQVQINSLILTGGGNFKFPVDHGGGILNEQAELTLSNVTITGNAAVSGAGIFNDGGTIELTDSTIDSNIASFHGGGICTIGGTVILNESKIMNNQFALTGGGIYAKYSTVVANGSEIARNYGVINDAVFYPEFGGGIYIHSSSSEAWNTLTLTNTKIHDNGAYKTGGGIYAERADVTLTGSSELSSNRADRRGGGAYVVGNLVLSGDTRIHDNTAFYNTPASGLGGGVSFTPFYASDRFTMSGNAMIYRNVALIEGGGIYGPAAYLINCNSGTAGEEGVNVFNNDPDDISP